MKIKLTNLGFLSISIGIKRKHLIFIMKTFVFLFCATVFSFTSNNVVSQNSKVKIEEDKLLTVDEVFEIIKKQTDYKFIYEVGVFKDLPKVEVKKGTISTNALLNKSLAAGHLNIIVTKDNTILIKQKLANPYQEQQQVSGKVTDMAGVPIPGVTVLIKGTNKGTVTDFDGNYTITVPNPENVLVFSALGLKEQEILVGNQNRIDIVMKEEISELDKVTIVSTGYQKLPKERATGSFAQVNIELLNRSVSTDVLSRLENITSGLLFDRRFLGSPTYSIRGLSTIQSDAKPLIVVDNFPYEGDVNNINPNDIESVTVLRDAAAASIWGVRAGNGVIVITTKKGSLEQPVTVEFNSNLTIGTKPDLYYNRGFLNSSDFINVEKSLFDQGYYTWTEGTYYLTSPVVQLLTAEKNGLISSEEVERAITSYKNQDLRDDVSKYMYRNSYNQQHSLSLKGGGSQVSYYLSSGFDKNLDNLKRNGYDRVTVNSMLNYRPLPSLEISSNVIISNTNDKTNNNSGFRGIVSGGGYSIYPYARLVDDDANPVSIVKDYSTEFVNQAEANGLLDWSYVPLNEMNNKDYTIKTNDVRINTALKYSINPALSLEARYQYEHQNKDTRNLQSQELYETRNMINHFAYEEDGQMVFPVPKGDILDIRNSVLVSHAGRLQVNYDKRWNDNQLNVLAGTEVRQAITTGSSNRFYGYNDDLLTYTNIDPTTSFLITPNGYTDYIDTGSSLSYIIDRNVSYFGNASYSYNNRYMISASARKDESNLFGVDANQKGVPLWSTGIGWRLSSESFYPFKSWMPMMKFRATYGYGGNVNKSLTAYATGAYRSNSVTGLSYIQIMTPPNPNLRWEKVKITNFGFDFETNNRFLSGSIEYYQKRGIDLIGKAPLDPTIGYNIAGRNEFIGNNASLKGHGIDVQLNFNKSISKTIDWTAHILYSYSTDEVTRYDYESNSMPSYFSPVAIPIVGQQRYTINSVKWAGLDPDTGDPQVYLNGEVTKEFSTLLSKMTMDDIVVNGSALPTHFGSFRNNFHLGDITVGFNISYKFGYYFRKTSISYAGLYNSWDGHEDYTRRWQNPGDESITQVPSAPTAGTTSMRDWAYQYSDYLVEKGDHIRFQDINLAYELKDTKHKWLPFSKLKMFGYINNIGILWRANKHHIDPDYIYQNYLAPRTYSFGVNVEF